MIAQRKNIKKDIDTLRNILHLINHKKPLLIQESSEKDLEKVTDYLQSIITKLEDKRQKMPIGYRYTGTFYLKKLFPFPSEVLKIKGSAFVREHLVSWELESEDSYAKSIGYVRTVYKDKALQKPLTKDDAVPVFEEKSE